MNSIWKKVQWAGIVEEGEKVNHGSSNLLKMHLQFVSHTLLAIKKLSVFISPYKEYLTVHTITI